jgi:hypothetical protein
MGNKETIEEVSPLTDLLKDLIQTKLKVKESIDLITNEFLASQINKFVQHTLDVIIERIENELLETESKFQQEKSYSDMQEYAEFCIKCDRLGLPCIIAKDWYERYKK